MNVVTLIGNLATDVELKELAEGKRVASFVLAVDRASKEGGADFVRVSVWDRQADLCRQFLHKGDRAALDGRLRSRSWEAPGALSRRRRAFAVREISTRRPSAPERWRRSSSALIAQISLSISCSLRNLARNSATWA